MSSDDEDYGFRILKERRRKERNRIFIILQNNDMEILKEIPISIKLKNNKNELITMEAKIKDRAEAQDQLNNSYYLLEIKNIDYTLDSSKPYIQKWVDLEQHGWMIYDIDKIIADNINRENNSPHRQMVIELKKLNQNVEQHHQMVMELKKLNQNVEHLIKLDEIKRNRIVIPQLGAKINRSRRKLGRKSITKPKTKISKTKIAKTKSTKTKNICWKGYHRVKGTAPYSKHSCAKNK